MVISLLEKSIWWPLQTQNLAFPGTAVLMANVIIGRTNHLIIYVLIEILHIYRSTSIPFFGLTLLIS